MGFKKKLQFSFDRLESLELKSCFLYCAIFPEDRELRIIELVDLWIKKGLVAGNNLTDSRKKGCDKVDILVDASLTTKKKNCFFTSSLLHQLKS